MGVGGAKGRGGEGCSNVRGYAGSTAAVVFSLLFACLLLMLLACGSSAHCWLSKPVCPPPVPLPLTNKHTLRSSPIWFPPPPPFPSAWTYSHTLRSSPICFTTALNSFLA